MSAEPSQANTEHRDREALIRERAYLLWEAEGRPEGRMDEYWHRARDLIEREREASYQPSQARDHRS